MTRTRLGFIGLLAASAAIFTPALPAQTADVGRTTPSRDYQRTSPSRDGVGVTYMGREIAEVMDPAGADWLERGARAKEERPDLLLAALPLRQGMTVADIGAGTGYYSWRISERIGPAGRVFAVDVQPEMLKRLGAEMKRRGVANVTPVLGTATEPRLPDASVDVMVMVDVYHEFEHPKEMLDALVRALKVDGRLVFVEYRAEDAAVPISPHHKMSEVQVRREATAAGLVWKETTETLPWQHVIVFTKPNADPIDSQRNSIIMRIIRN